MTDNDTDNEAPKTEVQSAIVREAKKQLEQDGYIGLIDPRMEADVEDDIRNNRPAIADHDGVTLIDRRVKTLAEEAEEKLAKLPGNIDDDDDDEDDLAAIENKKNAAERDLLAAQIRERARAYSQPPMQIKAPKRDKDPEKPHEILPHQRQDFWLEELKRRDRNERNKERDKKNKPATTSDNPATPSEVYNRQKAYHQTNEAAVYASSISNSRPF